jgi:hypothetical protein
VSAYEIPATGSAEVDVLFPAARIHDHWAVYVADRWTDRDADGVLLRPSVPPCNE